MIPINFQFIWLSGLAGDLKKKKTTQKQEVPMTAMFVYW